MKKKRHEKILELVSRYDIETQEELAGRLRDEGFCVTQATVSRDIRELELTKKPSVRGRQKYAAPADMGTVQSQERYLRILKEGFVSMDMAQNILVIKTGAGIAMAVAAALDGLHWSEIVGCIAGDDTVMCAIRSVEDTRKVMDNIYKIVH